jgi:hypothetical protein
MVAVMDKTRGTNHLLDIQPQEQRGGTTDKKKNSSRHNR